MNFSGANPMGMARRAFLRRGGAGLGTLALGSLLHPRLFAAESPGTTGVLRAKHHHGRCQRVIHLYMAGGPSHLETLDYKPKLASLDGTPMPESFTKGQPIAQLQGQALKCFAPQFPFQKYGKCGTEISSLFPHIGSVADDICVVRSMTT